MDELFTQMGASYQVDKGFAIASCTSNFPNIYFSFRGNLVQVRPDDYVLRNDLNTVCKLRIRPIDAPFNVMGIPVYKDYNVVHDYLLDAMVFQQTNDVTSKAKVEPQAKQASKVLPTAWATQNMPYGDIVAWVLTVGAFGASIYYVTVTYVIPGYGEWGLGKTYASEGDYWLIVAGVYLGCCVGTVLSYYVAMGALWPGNNLETVIPASDAIAKVFSSKLTFVGFLSLVAYKICGKRAEPKAAVKSEQDVNVDKLINSLE